MSSSTESDASATISKSWRPGPVLTSLRGGANSIPAGASRRIALVARIQPRADEAAGDDQVLDLAVRRERSLQPVRVDARNEEVRVLRLEAEQLVADGAADEIRVEAERVDVVLEFAPHRRILVYTEGDGFDLDERSRRELRDLDRRARRRPVADVRRVDAVHALEVAEVLEEHRRLDELVEP